MQRQGFLRQRTVNSLLQRNQQWISVTMQGFQTRHKDAGKICRLSSSTERRPVIMLSSSEG